MHRPRLGDDLVALRIHALAIGVVVLLLNARMSLTRCSGADGAARDPADGGADPGPMTVPGGSAQTGAQGGARQGFDNAFLVGAFGLTADLISGILLTQRLFLHEHFERFVGRGQNLHARPRRSFGAAAKSKGQKCGDGRETKYLHFILHDAQRG